MKCLTCKCSHDHHCPKGLSVENHLFLVYKLVKKYRSTGESEDIQDVINDAVVNLLENKHKYNPDRGAESNFVYWYVRGFMFNRRRKVDRVNLQVIEDTVGYIDERFRQSEFKEEANILLGKLTTDNQRTAVHLFFFEGLSFKGISQQLNIPISTVKGRHQTAVNMMRRD